METTDRQRYASERHSSCSVPWLPVTYNCNETSTNYSLEPSAVTIICILVRCDKVSPSMARLPGTVCGFTPLTDRHIQHRGVLNDNKPTYLRTIASGRHKAVSFLSPLVMTTYALTTRCTPVSTDLCSSVSSPLMTPEHGCVCNNSTQLMLTIIQISLMKSIYNSRPWMTCS